MPYYQLGYVLSKGGGPNLPVEFGVVDPCVFIQGQEAEEAFLTQRANASAIRLVDIGCLCVLDRPSLVLGA